MIDFSSDGGSGVPNPAAAVDVPITFLFRIVHQRRRATEQRR